MAAGSVVDAATSGLGGKVGGADTTMETVAVGATAASGVAAWSGTPFLIPAAVAIVALSGSVLPAPRTPLSAAGLGGTQPAGGITCTMLLHFGQLTMFPMAASLRTLSRAWQVVQTMENSGSATVPLSGLAGANRPPAVWASPGWVYQL